MNASSAYSKQGFALRLDKISLTMHQVTPQQKMAVIDSLQKQKHVCGFMGDGTNDGLALRKADVGICVDSGRGKTQAESWKLLDCAFCDSKVTTPSRYELTFGWCFQVLMWQNRLLTSSFWTKI